MAVSKSANTYNRQNWEDSEFPILCQTCLGENPYIRMTKEKYGKECKICVRPFTVFRWCPGAHSRYKKTEVCQTCSKLKNICQTCLLDLEYGLPIQVRDAALKLQDEIPKSDVNKEYYTQRMEREAAKTDGSTPLGALGKAQAPSDMLLKLARTTPYYKRNRPHICSFWGKGECRRGEECPYRHDFPTDPTDPLADQNIKDRYYGVNDPVADKLMRRYQNMPGLEPPEDKTITTLYIGNLGDKVTEKDLRDNFYQFGEIRSVSLVSKQQCAFIQFTTRQSAEAATEKTFNKLILNGRRLNIKWGRSQGQQSTSKKDAASESEPKLESVPGLPGVIPPPPEDVANNFFNLHQPPPLMQPMGIPTGMMPGRPPPPPMMPMGLPPPPRGMMPMPPAMPPMRMPPPPPIGLMPMRPPIHHVRMPIAVHYPSQDPTRMGAVGMPP